jgi:hypothetical protein
MKRGAQKHISIYEEDAREGEVYLQGPLQERAPSTCRTRNLASLTFELEALVNVLFDIHDT